MKYFFMLLIRFYQLVFSLDHSFWARNLNLRICRFYPSCSEYSFQAFKKYGVLKGGFLSFKRILHCQPFAKSGFDPLE